jgi:hypothetical protein
LPTVSVSCNHCGEAFMTRTSLQPRTAEPHSGDDTNQATAGAREPVGVTSPEAEKEQVGDPQASSTTGTSPAS